MTNSWINKDVTQINVEKLTDSELIELRAYVEKRVYKNAAHCIRLLRMGKEMMETGELQVYRPDREELIQIKQGEWSLEEINEEAERLFDEAREAKRNSSLPDKVDREAIEKLLVKNLSSILGA